MLKNIDESIKIAELKKVHLIGIGGISMSAIAHILLDRNIEVTGSDIVETDLVRGLIKAGAKIMVGHDKKIIENQDIIIYTGAVHDDNPEIIEARRKKIPILKRTQIIDIFMQEHTKSIAVAGTHGKSTTTTMTTMILDELGENPSFMIGANVPVFLDSHRLNDSDFIAVEACEYQGAFLDFNPTTLVITNIEYEHVDFFRDLDHVISTFRSFAQKLPPYGNLIYNADDENSVAVSEGVVCNKYSYGIEKKADYCAKNLHKDATGRFSFDVFFRGEHIAEVSLSIIGKFNVYNALAAIAAVHSNHVEVKFNLDILSKLQNASRRFEMLANIGNCALVSDYAHHHTEIMATLKAAKDTDYDDVIVFFQPHTYSRTNKFMENLAHAFGNADMCYIVDIYAAREDNIYGVSSIQLANQIAANGVKCEYIGDKKNVKKYFTKHLGGRNLLIFMGAGDMDFTVREMLKEIDYKLEMEIKSC